MIVQLDEFFTFQLYHLYYFPISECNHIYYNDKDTKRWSKDSLSARTKKTLEAFPNQPPQVSSYGKGMRSKFETA